jgi:hypothetical protein
MLPNEQGKFCNSCQKSVVDLNALSDKQIIDLLSTTSKVCGRIGQTRLDSFNNLDPVRYLFSWRKLSIAATFVAFVSLLKAEAKAPAAKPLTEQGSLTFSGLKNVGTDTTVTYKRIFGKVTEVGDTTGIAGARVFIKGTNIQTATDGNGKYTLNVPVSKSAILVVSYVGYSALETKLEVSKPAQQYNLVIKSNVALLGEVVIRRPSFIKRVYYKVTRPFRMLFRKRVKAV